MADYDFENPTFNPETDGPGIDDELSDAITDPLQRVQQELYMPGDIFQSLHG